MMSNPASRKKTGLRRIAGGMIELLVIILFAAPAIIFLSLLFHYAPT